MLNALANNGTVAMGEGMVSENDETKVPCKSMLDSGVFSFCTLVISSSTRIK